MIMLDKLDTFEPKQAEAERFFMRVCKQNSRLYLVYV